MILRIGSFLAIAVAVALAPFADAQSVRALGMGGAIAPAGAAATNPAYHGVPGAPTEFGLPLGLANLVLNDSIRPGSDRFDLLSVLDQASSLETLLWNPAHGPDEIEILPVLDGDRPRVVVRTEGGSTLALARGRPASFRSDTRLPLSFDTGQPGLRVGVRPYLTVHGAVTPDRAFSRVVREGASEGRVTFDAGVEAGVAGDVTFAAPLPLPADLMPATIYVGARAAPFVGLARIDAEGDLLVTARPGADGEIASSWTYRTDGFVAIVGDGGIGYGVAADLGVVAVVPTADGTVTAGLGVHDLSFERWSGYAVRIAGSDEAAVGRTERTPTTRSSFGSDLGLTATFAYDLDTAALGVPELTTLLLASDVAIGPGGPRGHLGAEAGVGVPFGTVLGRFGVGYEGGVTVGLGGGVRLPTFGIDLAVHGRRSPLADHTAFGVAAGLLFGF
ncbi:MAG: hypothetical protein WD336_07485 [Trueperaceae bacterium]